MNTNVYALAEFCSRRSRDVLAWNILILAVETREWLLPEKRAETTFK